MSRSKDRRSDKSLPVLSRVVQLRFTADQYDRLEKMATAAEIPVSQLVRLVVDHYLVDDPTAPAWLLEELSS